MASEKEASEESALEETALEETVVGLLKKKKMTLSLAESCTGGQIFAGAGPGAGGAGAAMEAAAERAERCRGGQNGAACAGAGRTAQGVERGIFRRYGPLPVLFAGGA